MAQTTWTGNASSDWNNANNWTQGIPSSTTDVIIPNNCTRYPDCVTGSTCRNIYIAGNARIGQQHLLTYTKAFVDVTIPTNRYVRITPPLKETYSGDFFTREQGGEWSEFTAAQYKPTDGTNGKNRVYPGATYQSLFSETSTQRGNYGETPVSTFTSGWADPKNALNTKYKALQALDVWVDTKEDGVATFHFPSQETTYYYYDQNGKKQSFGETTTRTAESGRFVYDDAYVNGIYDIKYDRSNNVNDPAFALGNPAMAYLDIREFLRLNGSSNITPYIYRHNETSLDRGTETILYYNKSTDKLYQVNNTNETTGTEVPATDPRNYIAPAHAFRMVSIPTEPRLTGKFNCTYSQPEIKLYWRFYEYYFNWGYKWRWKFSHSTIPAYQEVQTLTINPSETEPDQVILTNFAGKGTNINATVKPIDANHGTITIANGTYIQNLGSNNWYNGNKNLFIYGANSKNPTLTPTATFDEGNYTQGAQYVFTGMPNESWQAERNCYDYYTQYATDLNYDIVINYSISDDGKVRLSLNNGFAIYDEELKDGIKTNLVKKKGFGDGDGYGEDNNKNTNRGNLVAWWVYNDMTASKGTTEEKDVFIMPEALGNYSVFTRGDNIYGMPDVKSCADGNGNYYMTIRRYGNSYDKVTISGFYPGHDSYVMGTITYDGSKYTLTIPDGQLVKKNSETDNTKNYYLYGSRGTGSNNRRTNEAITMNWNGTEWRTPSNVLAELHAQVSLGNGQQPSNSNPGLYWYRNQDYNTLILIRVSITTEDNAVGTPPPSQETTVTQVALRFTPDMFKANPTITSGASLAPRRQGQEDAVTSPIVNIRATGEGVSGNTLIVVDSTARNAYSMTEDAPLFDVQDYNFCLATLAGEQLVGVNVLKDADIIPLYIQSSTETLTLHFDNVEALGDNIELYDALTEDSTHITSGSTVNITLYHGDEAGRFFLRRRAQQQEPTKPDGPATGISTTTVPHSLHAWSPMQGIAVVNAEQVPQGAHLHIIDMNGRIIYNTPLRPIQTVRGLTSGVYILKVSDSTTCQEVKLLVH